MGSFEKFCAFCYIMGFLSLMCLGYIYAFGIPNFENIDEQRIFCHENGGMAIEPHRSTYNTMICLMDYNNTAIEYVAREITNKDWAEHFGKEVGDYCFSCWDSRSCASPHNDILREQGVHC
jgi:hypothetical protein